MVVLYQIGRVDLNKSKLSIVTSSAFGCVMFVI